MITVKQLMESTVKSSPDGKHWEPALPMPYPHWHNLLRDAWSVFKGEAVAIRQTEKQDLKGGQHEDA